MVKIEIDTNGLKSAIEKAAIKAASEHVKKAVGTLRCSEHDKSPTVKIKGSSLKKLSFEVSGCCDDLIAKVKKKLS
jgi:hypothetical protein